MSDTTQKMRRLGWWNGLPYVRPQRLCANWEQAILARLDKGHASTAVRRAAFGDMLLGMAKEITPDMVMSRTERRLEAQREGVPKLQAAPKHE